MARVTVEDCLEEVENRFALVLLVSKRAKQLLKGATPKVKARSNKYIVTSLREVAVGSVTYDIEEAVHGTAREQIQADLKR